MWCVATWERIRTFGQNIPFITMATLKLPSGMSDFNTGHLISLILSDTFPELVTIVSTYMVIQN